MKGVMLLWRKVFAVCDQGQTCVSLVNVFVATPVSLSFNSFTIAGLK